LGPRLLLTIPLALFALAIGALPGCLDDLPEPTVCPAPAERPDCLDLPEPMQLGCIAPEELACFAPTCTCDANACPRSSSDCYPSGDCPEAVLRDYPDAVCKRIRDHAFGDFGIIDPGGFCSCGCVECLRVCDGRGPVVAVVNDGGRFDAADFPLPLAAIEELMPDRGTAGVYVRLRGYGLPLYLILFRKDLAQPAEVAFGATYAAIVLPNDGFVEQVAYRDLGTGDPYAWQDASAKPVYLGILPNVDADGDPLTITPMPQLVTIEIDCIVPFYVPGT
jgi:hypothetical protein